MPHDRDAEPPPLLDEGREHLRREIVIDLDEIVAVRLREIDHGAGLRRRGDDELAVARRAVHPEGEIDVRAGPAAAVDGRDDLVDEGARRAAHVEHRGDAIGEQHLHVERAGRMDVHVGEPRHEVAAAPVDHPRPRRRFDATADRGDAPVHDEHRPVGKDALAVHRHDIDVAQQHRRRFGLDGAGEGQEAEHGQCQGEDRAHGPHPSRPRAAVERRGAGGALSPPRARRDRGESRPSASRGSA